VVKTVIIKRFSLILLLALTSCSLFRSSEENARQLAVDTAVAYFTFDYENLDGWMKPVQGEFYYKDFIKEYVLPTLGPYMQDNWVQSTATLISADEYFRGTSQDGADVIIWEIVLQVDPPWPADGPPAPFGSDYDDIPWTNGSNTTVYAAAANQLGVWNIKLLTTGEVKGVIDSLGSQE
jgi:hypothetical protein